MKKQEVYTNRSFGEEIRASCAFMEINRKLIYQFSTFSPNKVVIYFDYVFDACMKDNIGSQREGTKVHTKV